MRLLKIMRFADSGSEAMRAMQTMRDAINWQKLKLSHTPTHPAGPGTSVEQ
jgi:hypothetical protein